MCRIVNLFCLLFFSNALVFARIDLGIDVFVSEKKYIKYLKKNIGLITNHTGVGKNSTPTGELLQKQKLHIKAFFSPEHGFKGSEKAFANVSDGKDDKGIPIYSLHGSTKRPTKEMLKGIDVLIYDIQDIGLRSYTYATTLYYVMEEAAKASIPLIVLDRPNPINGITVDGPMLDDKWRSFISYVNIPYCHGMTIGELADFYNQEYKIGCLLKVVSMRGWKRSMNYSQTGLRWVPPSPHIPEPDTPYFYASTGILGEIELANIGIGYTLPFKVVGAEWINAEEFAKALNALKLKGVHFNPFHYKPFYGSYKGKECHGVLIVVDDYKTYKPLNVQYAILGIIKSLYPKTFEKKLQGLLESKKTLFCKACGGEEIMNLLKKEKYVTYKLLNYHSVEREAFLEKRQKYLRKEYED